MNKFLTYQGQQPLYLGDIDFASDAVRDAFAQLLKGLTGSDGANAILRGVVGSTHNNNVVFSAGIVSIDGEILPVEANAGINGSMSDTFYLRVKSTYGGSRTFLDSETHDCWETRSVEVTKDVTDYPLAAFRRLQGGFGSQRWRYSQGGFDFWLVKTGLTWLVSLKRPAMSQSEEHFFDVSVPGIQAEDLAVFPTNEATVLTTAYIDTGSGVTTDVLSVKYYRDSGELKIQMDLESGLAAGNGSMQVILPVF